MLPDITDVKVPRPKQQVVTQPSSTWSIRRMHQKSIAAPHLRERVAPVTAAWCLDSAMRRQKTRRERKSETTATDQTRRRRKTGLDTEVCASNTNTEVGGQKKKEKRRPKLSKVRDGETSLRHKTFWPPLRQHTPTRKTSHRTRLGPLDHLT